MATELELAVDEPVGCVVDVVFSPIVVVEEVAVEVAVYEEKLW
jgi:hypothetical protein